jgi:hypothetical protein
MPLLKVLLNEKGEVVGTARSDAAASGKGAPHRVTLVARAGQRLVEVKVADETAALDAAALHAAIKAKHLS